jgi:capsular polysaccharide biosynthesis protein
MFKKRDKKEYFSHGKAVQKFILEFLSRYFNFIVLLVTLIILTGGYFFILKPKYEAIKKDIKEANAAKEEEKRSRSLELSRLNAYIRDYNSISISDKEKIYKLLPRSIQPEELMAEIEQLITRRGLILTSIQISGLDKNLDRKKNKAANIKVAKPKDQSQVKSIEIKVNILGLDYEGLKGLLRALENNLRLMDVTRLSFSPNGESAEMTIVVYYKK